MALWWLSYRTGYQPIGVAIVEAGSLDHARMLAAIGGIDAGLTFTYGHALDDEQTAMVSQSEIGRFLFLTEATQVRGRFKTQS